MEEFRSTEILDREIKEDARKKAERILKNADAEIEKIKKEVDKKIENLREDEEALYNKKINLYKADCESAIPLEKKRKKISFIASEINDSLDEYFNKLDDEKKLAIVSDSLKKFETITKNKKIKVRFMGFTQKQVEQAIKANLLTTEVVEYSKFTKEEAHIFNITYAIFIDENNEEFLCRASINEVKKQLLTEKRYELMSALFGEIKDE